VSYLVAAQKKLALCILSAGVLPSIDRQSCFIYSFDWQKSRNRQPATRELHQFVVQITKDCGCKC